MNQKKNKVGIIGGGYVGTGMRKIFKDALVYDIDATRCNASMKEINAECGLALVCVPTPPVGMKEQRVNEDESEFLSADISFVEEAVKNLETPLILIKSTVPPGTTDYLAKKYNKHVFFSPEYIGESTYYTPARYPHPTDPLAHGFLIVGGSIDDANGVDEVLTYFQPILGPATFYYKCSAIEAELIKYIENTWGATKVCFANEWFEICKAFGASFNTVREGWALDGRVEKMHTMVFENKRGFSGKCFPKDLLALIACSEKTGYCPELLKEVWSTNKKFLAMNEKNGS